MEALEKDKEFQRIAVGPESLPPEGRELASKV